MQNDYRKYLSIAVHAAKNAAQYLIRYNANCNDIIHDAAKDMKFKFDKDAEAIILSDLCESTGFKVITEERGIIESSAGETTYAWIVDPLDGSINYYNGIPFSCVSVSLWKNKCPVLGVVYDFNRDDLYEGIINEGAWLNKKSIKVKPFRKAEESILCSGFPAAMNYATSSVSDFVKLIQRFKKVRLLGSAALSLAYVASGRVDAYYEKRIRIWDVAAGIALVKAAGGEIMLDGFPEGNIVDAYAGTSLVLFEASIKENL